MSAAIVLEGIPYTLEAIRERAEQRAREWWQDQLPPPRDLLDRLIDGRVVVRAAEQYLGEREGGKS